MAAIIDCLGRVHRAVGEARLQALVDLAKVVPGRQADMQSWLRLEIASRSKAWIDELEAAVYNARDAGVLVNILPPFYQALDLPDGPVRTQRLRQRAVQLLMKDRQFAAALAVLAEFPERQPKLEAVCHKGLHDFRKAAECHLASENFKEALTCYRSIPDLEAALKLVSQTPDHPAADSLRWISEMQALVEKRPDKFRWCCRQRRSCSKTF